MKELLQEFILHMVRWLGTPWNDPDDVEWLRARRAYYQSKAEQIDAEIMKKLTLQRNNLRDS